MAVKATLIQQRENPYSKDRLGNYQQDHECKGLGRKRLSSIFTFLQMLVAFFLMDSPGWAICPLIYPFRAIQQTCLELLSGHANDPGTHPGVELVRPPIVFIPSTWRLWGQASEAIECPMPRVWKLVLVIPVPT